MTNFKSEFVSYHVLNGVSLFLLLKWFLFVKPILFTIQYAIDDIPEVLTNTAQVVYTYLDKKSPRG